MEAHHNLLVQFELKSSPLSIRNYSEELITKNVSNLMKTTHTPIQNVQKISSIGSRRKTTSSDNTMELFITSDKQKNFTAA